MALKEPLIPELPALPPSPRNSVCSDFMSPIQMESVAITTHSPTAPLDTIRTVTLTVSTVPETPEKDKKDKKDKKDNSRKRWCCFC